MNAEATYKTSAAFGTPLRKPASGIAPRDPPVGFIQLDIGMQVLVPTSHVPPDLLEYIRSKTQRELLKIRKMMEEENFKPTAQPPTKPAPQSDGQ